LLRVKYTVRKLKSCGWKPKFECQEFDGYHSYSEEYMTKPTKRRENKERTKRNWASQEKADPAADS